MIQDTQNFSVMAIYPAAPIAPKDAIFSHSIKLIKAKQVVMIPIEDRTSAVVLFILKGHGIIKEQNLRPRQAVYIPKGEEPVELLSSLTGIEFLLIRSIVQAYEGNASFFVEEMDDENPSDKDFGRNYKRNWLNPEHGEERLEIPYSIGFTEIKPGKSEKPFYWGNLFHYIIKGDATFKVDKLEQKLEKGDSVLTNNTWQMVSSTDKPLQYLTICDRFWKRTGQ